MNNSDQKNTLSKLQRISIFFVSIILVVLLLLFRGVLNSNSSLERLARNSLLPQEALSNGHPTIFEFYADWCEACNEMAPYMEKVKNSTSDQINIVLLNIDNPIWEELVQKYKVNGIPQMNFFDKYGQEKGYSIGIKKESQLLAIFNALINDQELPEFPGVSKKTDLSITYLNDRPSLSETIYNVKPRTHG